MKILKVLAELINRNFLSKEILKQNKTQRAERLFEHNNNVEESEQTRLPPMYLSLSGRR
jgi:hypothetical protein